MAKCLPFSDQERAALLSLGEFTFSPDGETAALSGTMKIEVVHPDKSDCYWVCVTLTSGECLNMILNQNELMMKEDY